MLDDTLISCNRWCQLVLLAVLLVLTVAGVVTRDTPHPLSGLTYIQWQGLFSLFVIISACLSPLTHNEDRTYWTRHFSLQVTADLARESNITTNAGQK